jgi:hypothetical protein
MCPFSLFHFFTGDTTAVFGINNQKHITAGAAAFLPNAQ